MVDSSNIGCLQDDSYGSSLQSKKIIHLGKGIIHLGKGMSLGKLCLCAK